MVIMTAKVPKRRYLAIALLAVVAVIVLAVLLSNSGKAANPAPETAQAQSQTQAQAPEKLKSNEDRIAYLKTYGWEVDDEPIQTQEVRVPTDPSEVFLRYNDLQKSQGFDLEQFAGKTVKRYVYEIENYPNKVEDEEFFVTLLIYKDQVIGGDVCSSKKGGVMHGLAMPAATALLTEPVVETATVEETAQLLP